MLTKIKWFLKGIKICTTTFFIIGSYSLYKENIRLKEEIEELKNKPTSTYTYYKKHAKGGLIPKENPKHPIGFTSNY